jgi:hypothetical protein
MEPGLALDFRQRLLRHFYVPRIFRNTDAQNSACPLRSGAAEARGAQLAVHKKKPRGKLNRRRRVLQVFNPADSLEMT